jgi:uracil-DNA glycosylase
LIYLIRGRRGTHWQTKREGDMLASRSAATAQEKFALLNCRRLPGRVNTSEAALLLGFHEHDIALLVAAKLVVPLGKPAANAPKYFAAVEISERASDPEWLSSATKSSTSESWLCNDMGSSVYKAEL